MCDPALRKIDRSNMYDNLLNFPRQIVDGIKIGQSADLHGLTERKYDSIILAGMGGSAITGDLLKGALSDELKIPFEIHRNYGLPAYANEDTLVICSSYSGNTEETLAAFDRAVEYGCKILCITTGGLLQEKARNKNIPLIEMPGGLMPREALGYSFTPLLVALGRLRLAEDHVAELQGCSIRLQAWKERYFFEAGQNPAYDMAQKLAGRITIIYSEPERIGAAAMRLKGQLAENAKQLAFCNMFPEFNHNELVGWELTAKHASRLIVVIMRDKEDHPQIVRRMEAVKRILDERNIETVELYSRGDNRIERIFSLVQLGDFISYYTALINGVDPSPIDVIEYLKQVLAKKERR